jgi:2-aminoethylphosphonate-pyruvate transaminase
MPETETAVFLAAGLGSRLKGLSHDKPKGFLEIEGISLIERSVQNLLDSGIKHLFFGTGFRSDVYEDFAVKYDATCIKNEFYSGTGSMFTLYNMRNHIKNGFLLLEADLLYDKAGITTLLEDPHPDVILASGRTNSGDEVFIETDTRSFLKNMSKDPSQLANSNTELVGISKVSAEAYLQMCRIAERQFTAKPKLDYEYVFVELARSSEIFVKKVENFVWCEIDDEHHFQRALTKVFPLLK